MNLDALRMPALPASSAVFFTLLLNSYLSFTLLTLYPKKTKKKHEALLHSGEIV